MTDNQESTPQREHAEVMQWARDMRELFPQCKKRYQLTVEGELGDGSLSDRALGYGDE